MRQPGWDVEGGGQEKKVWEPLIYGIIQVPHFTDTVFEFFFLTKVVFSPMMAYIKGLVRL